MLNRAGCGAQCFPSSVISWLQLYPQFMQSGFWIKWNTKIWSQETMSTWKIWLSKLFYVLKMRITSFFAHKMESLSSLRVILFSEQTINLFASSASEIYRLKHWIGVFLRINKSHILNFHGKFAWIYPHFGHISCKL